MNQFTERVMRFAAIFSTAFGISIIINQANHRGYWNGTIYRVQTVDFNILSHTLPTKLSYALVEDEISEIQRTLDSNYGLFGMVVTDCETELINCPGQKILYTSNSSSSWKRLLDEKGVNYLAEINAPFDVLRNPPPLFSAGGFDSSRDDTWKSKIVNNEGQIIGRVYYVRGVPPKFWESYWRWIRRIPRGSLFRDSGTYKYFTLTGLICLLGAILIGFIIELFLFRYRRSQQALILAKQEVNKLYDDRNKSLSHHNAVISRLNQSISQKISHNNQLQNEIDQYSNQLHKNQAKWKSQQQQLLTLKDQLDIVRSERALTQSAIQERENKINNLETEISRLEVDNQENEKLQAQLNEYIDGNQKIKDVASKLILDLENKVKSVEDEKTQIIERTCQLEDDLNNLRNNLEQKISRLKDQHRNEIETYQSRLDQLQADYDQARAMESYALEEASRLEALAQLSSQTSPDNLNYSGYLYDGTPSEEDLDKAVVSPIQNIDFSKVKLGIVGGHPDFQRSIASKLYEKGLQLEPVIISSSKNGGNLSASKLRGRLNRCNLILVFTYYAGHNLTQNVNSLVENGSLDAIVRTYGGSCKPDIVNDFLSFLENCPEFQYSRSYSNPAR